MTYFVICSGVGNCSIADSIDLRNFSEVFGYLSFDIGNIYELRIAQFEVSFGTYGLSSTHRVLN